MITNHLLSASVALAVLASGCGDDGTTGSAKTFDFAFASGTNDFMASFADYPVGMDTFYELRSGVATLPSPLSGGSFVLEGNNHSDDLFMYMFRRVDGLTPGTTF